jgi:hypothetical protein
MAEVPALDAAVSLLALSRRGRPEEVAAELASLHGDPALRDFYLSVGGWLQCICDELIGPVPCSNEITQVASPPAGISLDDYRKAMQAFGYGPLGTSFHFGEAGVDGERRQIVPESDPKPRTMLDTREGVLARVEECLAALRKAAKTAGYGPGVRVDNPRDLAAWCRDELKGEYLLPSIESLWLAAEGLNLQGVQVPPFSGEPQTTPDAIQALVNVAQYLRDAAEPPQANPSVPEGEGANGEQAAGGDQQVVPDTSDKLSAVDAGSPGLAAPSDDAIKAYRLKWILGVPTQTDIAKKLTEESGRPISQGQVSRWLKSAEKFVQRGGVLPEIQSVARNKPTPIDPDHIDLGRRQDGRAKQQRPRRDSESDD